MADESFAVLLMSGQEIVVIGAGVVGASTALALQTDGHQVTLIDQEGPCAGASFGNAGGVVNDFCVPTAVPGIVFDVLRMIGRPLTPFTIRLRHLPAALPWMLRFLNESRRSRVHRNAQNLHALTRAAAQSWRTLTSGTELAALLQPAGWLKVYESDASFARAAFARSLMDELGAPYEVLDAADIQALEPDLAPIFARAIFQPDSLSVTDPGKMTGSMVELFLRRGGNFRVFTAKRLEIRADDIVVHENADSLAADKIVIAAGAWSRPLAAQVGDRVPLDTERGYHLMLPATNSTMLGRPVMSGDHSFVLAPMRDGLRLTSQVEFAGLVAAPDYARVRSLVPVVARMLPGIDTAEQSVWMGFRPSLPDSLPVLGFATRCDRVLYAFGHQHLGMTLGPRTARITADLVAGRNPRIDLHPYRAARF
jgi:D-amino-acid dehydrogenase